MKPGKRQQAISRRTFLATAATLAGAAAVTPAAATGAEANAARALERAIPSSGERLAAIGLGTWITFNVGDDPVAQEQRTAVLRAFFAAGGGMIDSSPMYGSAQAVIGRGLQDLGHPPGLFAADKVWTPFAGPAQIEQSRRLWGVPRFDLLQVHNLLAWESHLQTLKAMKAEGELRYLGITTSEGRRHDEFERIMRREPLDFVQFTYNVLDREAEARLLPLARDRGIAVIANRPFRQGALTEALEPHPLPGWAAEIGCDSWAMALLKFILSEPGVTCAIPATSRVDHLRENMGAARQPLPDQALRARMIADVERLA
jgi:aryl-alcohol dehydrogenase-like predicted oxidoreductase